jgi:hypothetical protein
MGFFSKRPGQRDLGTAEDNPSALDAVEDLPLIEKAELVRHGGLDLVDEAAETATTQDIGRDMEDDGAAMSDAEERTFDQFGSGDSGDAGPDA